VRFTFFLFGVYVIYQTWTFQRQALLAETRWVLLALYNVILTLCVIAPLCALVNLSDAVLSLIATIGIDVSGGGIIAAVLLPRVISKLELSETSKHSNQTKADTLVTTSTGKERRFFDQEDKALNATDTDCSRLDTLPKIDDSFQRFSSAAIKDNTTQGSAVELSSLHSALQESPQLAAIDSPSGHGPLPSLSTLPGGLNQLHEFEEDTLELNVQ